jgi:hypothetical protein
LIISSNKVFLYNIFSKFSTIVVKLLSYLMSYILLILKNINIILKSLKMILNILNLFLLLPLLECQYFGNIVYSKIQKLPIT